MSKRRYEQRYRDMSYVDLHKEVHNVIREAEEVQAQTGLWARLSMSFKLDNCTMRLNLLNDECRRRTIELLDYGTAAEKFAQKG